MDTKIKKDIAQWREDFPKYAEKIIDKKLLPNAFANATLPSDFYLPEGLEQIGNNAFAAAIMSNEDFDLPTTLKIIGNDAFADAKLESDSHWNIPSSVEEISSGCFSQLEFNGSFKLNEGLRVIQSGAFESTVLNLDNLIDLPTSIITIEEGAFENAAYFFRNKKYFVPASTDSVFLRNWFKDPNQSTK